jgi:hypothetical protein
MNLAKFNQNRIFRLGAAAKKSFRTMQSKGEGNFKAAQVKIGPIDFGLIHRIVCGPNIPR